MMVPTAPGVEPCHQDFLHISLAVTKTFSMYSVTKDIHVLPQASFMLHVKTCLLLNRTQLWTITQLLLSLPSPLCLILLRAIQCLSQFASHPRTCDMAQFFSTFDFAEPPLVTIAGPGTNKQTQTQNTDLLILWH